MKKIVLFLCLSLYLSKAVACPTIEYKNLTCSDGAVIESYKIENSVVTMKEKGFTKSQIFLPHKVARDEWSIKYSCVENMVVVQQSTDLVRAQSVYVFSENGFTLIGTELQYGCEDELCKSGSTYYLKSVNLECN